MVKSADLALRTQKFAAELRIVFQCPRVYLIATNATFLFMG